MPVARDANRNQLRKAIDHALSGDWEAAHKIVQKMETDPIAVWIHAVLHKVSIRGFPFRVA